MSGFKTHRTSPAAKVIHVWIVLIVMMTFMNVHYDVLHVEYSLSTALSWGAAWEGQKSTENNLEEKGGCVVAQRARDGFLHFSQ